ncbi:MAG: hypothetical protein BYD32DRAFT_428169, partial [Podila humilis]
EYHHSKLLKHLDYMREIRVRIEVDGKTEDQILDEIQEYQQNSLEWDYENACQDILGSSDSPTPCRFLVLPADLSSWNDSDSTTHQFRLYFLCDTISEDNHQPGLSQRRHLSNHPGYKLDRPQEFFQAFGGLTLTMLKMVRQGASHPRSKIPPLETFEILWNFEPEITSHRITEATIWSLIDKSINYLQALPVAKCAAQYFWSMKSAIKDFLVVPDGSNSLGGLCRSSNLANEQRWTCQQHGHQWLPPGSLETLINFVQECGGHVDLQRASLSIALCSRHQAEQLCTLIKNTNQRLDVSITLGWDASHRDLGDLLQDIVNAKVYSLELDGVTQSMHLKGDNKYRTDLIANCILFLSGLGSVTLLNYPQPQEQYIYLQTFYSSAYRLHLKQQQQVETKHLTMELENALSSFEEAIMANWKNDLLEAKSRRLQRLLVEAGYHTVSRIGSYQRSWHGDFNATEGTLQELQLHELWALRPFVTLEALGSLRTLRVDVDDMTNHREEITQMLQASLQLQELIIWLQENRMLESIEKTIEMWQGRSSPLQLTLLEYASDDRSHAVAQVIVSNHVSSHPGSSDTNLERTNTSRATAEFLQWSSDRVSAPLTNLTATFLDTATKQHPSVLTSFTLDVSNLSQEGISHINNILQQSMLGHLHIYCTMFNTGLPDFVHRVLLSNRWDMLQSLILSGAAVKDWIRALAAITKTALFGLQLQCLRIQGSGRYPVVLSHACVLFVHQMLYLNPSMEIVMENVFLQDQRDSSLLPEIHHS